MPREIVTSWREQEIRMIRGTRYRYTYEYTHYRVTRRRLVFRTRPTLRSGVRFASHGYPYRVVPHKGARFISYKDAFTMYEEPYTKMVSYDKIERRYIEREKLPPTEDRMMQYNYTIRNKSRGESKRIRHVEGTITSYYDIEDYRMKVLSQKTLEDKVGGSEWGWILANFDVEGEEEREVPLDENLINTYSIVVMDYDYKTVRFRSSGNL